MNNLTCIFCYVEAASQLCASDRLRDINAVHTEQMNPVQSFVKVLRKSKNHKSKRSFLLLQMLVPSVTINV